MATSAAPGVRASQRRDNAAARLYIEYRERIYRFCLARLRNREEAEDAVQNVFMRVHMALDRGVVPQFEAAWLYKIAHNVCLSRAESTSRRTSFEALSSFDDDELPVAAPEVSRDELAGLSEALEGMPHNLRTAILLREWQGLSYAEIAAAMGLSVSAVETLIFRARRHLSYALEHPGEKKKTVGARLLNLLNLGWLRGFLFGAGPAKLAAGAALLALTGGGAAVALSDAHARPAPAKHLPSIAPPAFVARTFRKPSPVAPPSATKVPGTEGAGHRSVLTRPTHATGHPVAPAAGGTPATTPAATPAVAGTHASSSQPQPQAPAAGSKPAPVPALSTPTTPKAPTPSVPTVSTPTPSVPTLSTPTPTVSVPSVEVPTVSTPSVSVPSVSVPTVSVPVGGSVLG